MKRYLLSLTGAAALALLLSQPILAQDNDNDKDKDKDKLKEKSKLDQYEEIIIRKKNDKNTKVTIEIKDGAVLVNGAPLEEFNNDDVSVRKSKSVTLRSRSPFRSPGSAWSFSGDPLMEAPAGGNKAFLGVSTEEDNGARIEEVTKGSAAEKAGLKKGDVITRVNDSKIENPSDLTEAISKFEPEDKVTVSYKREGKENKTTATLGKRKMATTYNIESLPRFEAPHLEGLPDFGQGWGHDAGPMPFGPVGKPRLGIKAQDTEDGKGVKVLEVADESAADKAGIKEDDLITEFDGKPVNNADQLAAAARESKEKASVKVKLTRNGKPEVVEIKTPKKLKTTNL